MIFAPQQWNPMVGQFEKFNPQFYNLSKTHLQYLLKLCMNIDALMTLNEKKSYILRRNQQFNQCFKQLRNQV